MRCCPFWIFPLLLISYTCRPLSNLRWRDGHGQPLCALGIIPKSIITSRSTPFFGLFLFLVASGAEKLLAAETVITQVLSCLLHFERRTRHMRTSSLAGVKRQRSGPSGKEKILENDLTCSFCRQVPAAVSVEVPVLHRKNRASAPYCVACYYTTSVIRYEPKFISIINQSQLDEQLPPMQQMFSEVYVELQKELMDESALIFKEQRNDPLGMLHHASRKRRNSKPPPVAQKKKGGDASDGGFLRSVPLPERLLRTQHEQALLQQAQLARINQAAKESSFVYKRRKPARKSIWNLALDPKAAEAIEVAKSGPVTHNHTPTCSCGSKDVRSFGTVTSRNQDMRKGETWGMKDRGDDVVARYQCNACGKTWNEEA